MVFGVHYVLLLVCAYGIIKEFRPATPFLSAFLQSKNFTNVEIYSDIYPYWTYSYLVFLVPVFFVTDLLRYKPVVVLEAFSLTLTWGLLVFGDTVWEMRAMQIAFGLASSAEIAYYSYLYAVVDRRNFKKVTSYIRSAVLLGKFFAYAAAQILISTGIGSYLLLNQVTLGAVASTLVIALLLQWRGAAAGTDRVGGAEAAAGDGAAAEAELRRARRAKTAPRLGAGVAAELAAAWRTPAVRAWSAWWALATAGAYQVANYAQSLWAPLHDQGQFMGNGLAECVATLLSTLLTFLLQYSELDWRRRGAAVLAGAGALSALLLCGMAAARRVWLSYACYALHAALHHVLAAAAAHAVAARLPGARFALIFGANTLAALGVQSALTWALADRRGWLRLPIRAQFAAYAAYFAALGLGFAPAALRQCCAPTAPPPPLDPDLGEEQTERSRIANSA